MKSFLLGDDINIRWEVKPPKNTNIKIVGADGGQTTCLTLSDGNITKPCIHGHDLKSINAKMARKKLGSAAYHKAALHQENYINWSIKQLNLVQYKEVKFETNKNIKRGNRRSRSLTAWSWSKIHKAVTMNCEAANVLLSLQLSPYKSQRCHGCGYTHKSNRRGKLFKCKSCELKCDADLNSALNNSVSLPVISRSFMALGWNKVGFFWNPNTPLPNGQVNTVPVGKNQGHVHKII